VNDTDEAIVEGSDVQVDGFARGNDDANGAAEDYAGPRDIKDAPDHHTLNTGNEQYEHRDTKVVPDINAFNVTINTADDERSTTIHTEGQKNTASVNTKEGYTVQDDADREAEVAVSAAPELKRLGEEVDMDTMHANDAEELDVCESATRGPNMSAKNNRRSF